MNDTTLLFGALLLFFNLDAGHYARLNVIIVVMVATALALVLLCLDVAEPIRASLELDQVCCPR